MSSSAINAQLFQAKIGSIQNQADSSAVYSAGVWSFKNSTAVTSVTITDAGNVGIGVATPASYYLPNLVVNSAGNTGISIIGGASSIGALSFGKGTGVNVGDNSNRGKIWYDFSGDSLNFSTAGSLLTPSMRIDASGNLLVGTTSTLNGNKLFVSGATLVAGINVTNGTGEAYRFYSNGTAVGTITVTGSSTAYNVNSDYRLKEDVQPISAALSKVAALKPCTYKWKSDGSEGEGFIAHELAEVCPAAVTGEKDAVNEDGSIKLQGIDPSKLIGLLTAAIQELSAKVDAQAAEIEALKAK